MDRSPGYSKGCETSGDNPKSPQEESGPKTPDHTNCELTFSPHSSEQAPKPALTPEQLQRIADLRAFAAKKQKVAQLLIAADLAEEVEPHQKAAEKALAEALAIESVSA